MGALATHTICLLHVARTDSCKLSHLYVLVKRKGENSRWWRAESRDNSAKVEIVMCSQNHAHICTVFNHLNVCGGTIIGFHSTIFVIERAIARLAELLCARGP